MTLNYRSDKNRESNLEIISKRINIPLAKIIARESCSLRIPVNLKGKTLHDRDFTLYSRMLKRCKSSFDGERFSTTKKKSLACRLIRVVNMVNDSSCRNDGDFQVFASVENLSRYGDIKYITN